MTDKTYSVEEVRAGAPAEAPDALVAWVTEQANLAKTIAGTNQYSKLQTIMAGCSEAAAEGGQSFSDYTAALNNCAGSADKMAGTMLDNMNGRLVLRSLG